MRQTSNENIVRTLDSTTNRKYFNNGIKNYDSGVPISKLFKNPVSKFPFLKSSSFINF